MAPKLSLSCNKDERSVHGGHVCKGVVRLGVRLDVQHRCRVTANIVKFNVISTAHLKTNLMEPVVIALASNERYFPGLYSAVASALGYLDSTREADLKVLDGGI